MANRTTAAPFELTEEQVAYSNSLHRINLARPDERTLLIDQLAEQRGVCDRTIRREAEKHKKDPYSVFQRQSRSDNGAFRLPRKTLVLILEYFWQNPAHSAAQALSHLLEHQGEAMTYTSGSGAARQVSIGTVRRVQKIFLNGWLKEVEGQTDSDPLS